MIPKRIFLSFLCIFSLTLSVFAQESTSVFDFLSLPTSARAVALGGTNISIIEDDASLGFHNPALYSSVSDKTACMSFMTFLSGGKAATANYVQASGQRGTWAVGIQYVGYGDIKETTEAEQILGTTSAKDMGINASYCYALSDYWVGGATTKILYSRYGAFSSVALAFDVAVNYYNQQKDFSFSFVAANLGAQLKAFGSERESLPINLCIGASKGLGSFPARVSLSFDDLTHWDGKFLNHLNLGLDVMPMKGKLWLAMGYNFRRADEMTAAGSSHAAGLTLGAGMNVKKIKFGISYAKYHVGSSTLAFTLAYSFAKNKTQQ